MIESLVNLNDDHKVPASTIDARMTAISAEIAIARYIFTDDVGNSKLINDQLGAQIIEVNQKNEATRQHLATTIVEFRYEKEANKQL